MVGGTKNNLMDQRSSRNIYSTPAAEGQLKELMEARIVKGPSDAYQRGLRILYQQFKAQLAAPLQGQPLEIFHAIRLITCTQCQAEYSTVLHSCPACASGITSSASEEAKTGPVSPAPLPTD